MSAKMRHATTNHAKHYADRTIERFWSLAKRAWYGSHHHYSRDWASLYVAEACYKYNIHRNKNRFAGFIRAVIG